MTDQILRQFEPDADLVAIAKKRSRDVEKRAPLDLKLYALGWSICSQRPRLTIEEKQLPYKEHTVDFRVSENLEPWYLKMNPRGVVPTITENGRTLFDSYTVMLYVNNQFEGPELTPDDDAAYDQMIEYMTQADFFPIRQFAYWQVLTEDTPDHWRVMMYERVLEYRQKYPEFKDIYDQKIKDYFSVANMSSSPQAMVKLRADCDVLLDKIDNALSKHKWIVGDDLSLADIAWLPIFLRLDTVDPTIRGGDRRKNIGRWLEDWKKRPTFKTAIENHYEKVTRQMQDLKGVAKSA